MISFDQFVNENLISLNYSPINEVRLSPSFIDVRNGIEAVGGEISEIDQWYADEFKKLQELQNKLNIDRSKMHLDVKIRNKEKTEKELLERFKDKLLCIGDHTYGVMPINKIGKVIKVELEIKGIENHYGGHSSLNVIENRKLMMSNGETIPLLHTTYIINLDDLLNRLNKSKGRKIDFYGVLLENVNIKIKNKRATWKTTRLSTIFEKYEIIALPKIGDCVVINDEYVMHVANGFDSILIRVDENDPLGEEDWGDEE